jgi:DNA-binding transcriptional MerR regulator
MSSPKEPDGSELLKIGDFARLAGTNLRTLRYYEELGLLAPAERSQGGFRYYRATDVNRLNMIRDLQELGLHLDRIRELMATRQAPAGRSEFLGRVRQALIEQDRLLAERIATLQGQRDNLAVARAKLSECECCKHVPQAANNFCEPCVITGQPLPAKVSALY